MKFKTIPDEYYVTILDRLTRFEPAHKRYKRVFDDIINKFCIDIKAKNLNINEQISVVEDILNFSLESDIDDIITPIFSGLEEKYFKYDNTSYQYLSCRINLSAMFNKISNFDNLPQNIEWLKFIKNNYDLRKNRSEHSLLYPVEKIILCEGETERLLLPVLLKICGVDIYKKGIFLIPAGGKNQVARKYYQMADYTILPFFVLLDIDAMQTKLLINRKLRQDDAVYIINSGEFEDLIPKNILINVINSVHDNELHCNINDFDEALVNSKNLDLIYKKYGFGEFKKAHFAHQLKEHIEKNCTKADFEGLEITEIAKLLD